MPPKNTAGLIASLEDTRQIYQRKLSGLQREYGRLEDEATFTDNPRIDRIRDRMGNLDDRIRELTTSITDLDEAIDRLSSPVVWTQEKIRTLAGMLLEEMNLQDDWDWSDARKCASMLEIAYPGMDWEAAMGTEAVPNPNQEDAP